MYTEEITEKILDKAIRIGKIRIANGSAPKYSDSVVTENFMVELLREAAALFGYKPETILHHGGHSFPDVSLSKSNIGIELKGTTSNRRFNGNSVVASTMLPNLKKLYLFYWIGSTGELGWRDYFECVSTPVVTHSPRFQLDIDLKPHQSMFGDEPDKVGSIDKIIFGKNGIDSYKIIKWMSEKAKTKGETPWWISDDDSLPVGSTGLVRCTNLPPHKRRAFMKSAFLAFPAILGRTSPTKYNGFFEWAISFKSVYSTRDDFSAGGKVTMGLPQFSNVKLDLPQVIQVALESLSADDQVFLSELEEPHGRRFKNVEEFIHYYKSNLPKYLTHMYFEVKNHDINKIGVEGFSRLLADKLISEISVKTIM